MTIEEKYNRFKALQKGLRGIGMTTLTETSDVYLDLQREQMTRGLNNEGNRIGEYASNVYSAMKERMNPLAGGYVDLKVSEDFQNELTIRRLSDRKFEEYSQDWKMLKLAKQYGSGIFYLNPKYLYDYRKSTFMPALKIKCNAVVSG